MYDVLAVSGYKPHEIGVFNEKHDQLPYLKKALTKKIGQLIEEYDVKWIMTSGQSGVELWSAESCIHLKKMYPHIQIATIAPFHNQEERYAEATKSLYETVWNESDYCDFITKRPYDSPAQLRLKNQFIVDKSDAALILYDEGTEGTPKYFQEEAVKKQAHTDYPVFYLTPDDIEEMVRDEMNNDTWN
ncbi:DUF1273 domain-containing protein [Salipaludibacillus agaradhaerens]|uniref:DUF1273 domain-containing protein n=1 Tax=Salipaludibacillus agaradhaerens TaxID=76935 RepID=UPI0021508230|nr:DUF1273 domain-containing protein [Salipaludibacillus agaradhaerens]MCR6106855.1 DUF1273 domain-containing protein [Salipaludibacillus agaradhaerens]MCR6118887.1 DUF1273 domain-containing protein [Salipaludibacillus agaradhaerens]UJW57961.1 DUF1273 domain-containing protein [Bacillus sp. A116_S68]